MPTRLGMFALPYLSGRKSRDSLTTPVLIWEAPSDQKKGEALLQTVAAARSSGNVPGAEPLVFELVKSSSQNIFANGITVGHTDNNDVVIADGTVSRFHAYFQKDEKTGTWTLTDAGSKHGTWVGPLRLAANQPQRVGDGATLRFGAVNVRFFLPGSLFQWIDARVAEE